MAGVKTAVMKATMTGLYHTGAHRLLAPYTQGSAVIFHAAPCPAAASEGLCPEPHPRGRAPIPRCLARPGRGGGTGYRFPRRGRAAPQGGREEALRLFHFRRRLPGQSRYAYPLFKRRSLPLTIYVPTDYPSERGELWWLTEEVVARAEEIELCRNSELWRLPTGTVQEKERSHDQIYWWLRSVDEPTQRRIVRTLADRNEIDTAAGCRDLVMNWDEIRTLAADPLVTIGAHTKGHYAIAKLCAEEAIEEVRGGADVLERAFALPKELGFKTAVTTRKGVLFPAHKRYLTALPRAQRRVSVPDLYGALSHRRTVRPVESLSAGERRLSAV